ncbi:hypothetical protein BGZ94_007108 [Podila epigama]|nr:hypothetical protein BGZ94_007108 [Podila epigama]
MNLFRSKKKDEPVAPSPTSPHRTSQPRGTSVNGISIPARGNQQPGTQMSHNNGSNVSANVLPGGGNNGGGNSPRNNPNLDQQQQQYLQQQQQQQMYMQQQHLHQPQRDSDSISLNAGAHGQGSYNNDSILKSQGHHIHSQQTSDNYDGYPMDDDQLASQQLRNEDLASGSGQDGYYKNNAKNNNNNNGPLLSGQLHLPTNTSNNNNHGHPNGNSLENGNSNNGNSNNNGSSSALGSGVPSSGSSEVLSTDVRKLQEEVKSWKKSHDIKQTKLDQLRLTLSQKSQENRELHTSLQQVTQDRLMLQELVHKREKEMDDLRSKYLNDVRQIRATDDDHSTIEQRVRVLQAAILQLTKSSSGDRAVNLNIEEAQQLVKKQYKFGNSQPYILNMFLEKYIMDCLLKEVFHRPFYVGLNLGAQFSDIFQWMNENNFPDQATRFRQQLCFLSAKSPSAQAFATQEAQRIAKLFEPKLERLYNNWTGQQKVLDLVTKAIELSLTMKSQNAEIVAQVIANESEFDAEKMVPAHKSKEGGKVKVCVTPCFIDTNGVIVGKAKVFCG